MSLHFFILFICTAIISMSATGIVLKYLIQKAILDHPNDRSSHSIPTPRGGGIGILIAVLPGLFLVQFFSESSLHGYEAVLACTLGLALLSWLDDLKNLGPAIRFATQIICVSICLFILPDPSEGFLGGFLPIWAEKIILGIGWVWFINLFNFMDGIDGISGVEIVSISLGLILVAVIGELATSYIETGIILTAAALGFLKWNWHKARVFMGDVGSVPLGFILGWLLILLAAEGYVVCALILPLYYLMDATITLIKRALRKEKIWQAHREHFYQKATQAGMAHDKVVLKIALVNILLLGLSWVAVTVSAPAALGVSVLLVAFCLFHFANAFRSKQLKSE